MRPHESQALPELPTHRRPSLGALDPDRTPLADQMQIGSGGDQEGAGVEDEGPAGADRSDEPAADGRSDEQEGERPDELVERIRLEREVARNDLRNDRREGRAEERFAGPEHDGESDQMPSSIVPVSERTAIAAAATARTTSAAIMMRRRSKRSDDAAEEHEEAQGRRPGYADQRERGRRVGRRPATRARRRRRRRRPATRSLRPEQGEVPDPERAKDAHAGQAAGLVPFRAPWRSVGAPSQ